MGIQIVNWLYQNAMAIFISAIASLLISKRYYDKANRESVLMTVIFPIVKLLNQRYYTRRDYEAFFEINSSYALKYLRKKERNKLLELLSVYRDVCRYSKEGADTIQFKGDVALAIKQIIKEFGNEKLTNLFEKNETLYSDVSHVVKIDVWICAYIYFCISENGI